MTYEEIILNSKINFSHFAEIFGAKKYNSTQIIFIHKSEKRFSVCFIKQEKKIKLLLWDKNQSGSLRVHEVNYFEDFMSEYISKEDLKRFIQKKKIENI